MNKLRTVCRNSSSVSIWKASATNVLSDTSENEKGQKAVIGMEGLRDINRIVRAIKGRIEAELFPVE